MQLTIQIGLATFITVIVFALLFDDDKQGEQNGEGLSCGDLRRKDQRSHQR